MDAGSGWRCQPNRIESLLVDTQGSFSTRQCLASGWVGENKAADGCSNPADSKLLLGARAGRGVCGKEDLLHGLKARKDLYHTDPILVQPKGNRLFIKEGRSPIVEEITDTPFPLTGHSESEGLKIPGGALRFFLGVGDRAQVRLFAGGGRRWG